MTQTLEPSTQVIEPIQETDSLPGRARAQREVRRNVASVRRTDVFAVVGAFAAAVATTALLYGSFAPFSGAVGFVIIMYALFLGCYALLVSFDESWPVVRDRLASAVIHSLAIILLAGLASVVIYTVWRGRQALAHLNFFTDDMGDAGPLEPLTVGGIKHALIGTLEQIGLSLAFSVPLGLTCAVFLSEVPGRYSRFVRTIVEAMTALPSIVAGLFVYATLILILGLPKSGLAASVAITVMMLPIIVRAADVVIRLVPQTLREAALATGASRWRTVWHVVLPTARSGLTTAVILGTARGIGETSPVLLTAGFTTLTNTDPTSGPMVSLPLATFQFVKSPQPAMVARGFGTAAVLMILVLVLFAIARLIGGKAPGQISKRQEQRGARRSRRDARRFRLLEPPAAPARSEPATEQGSP